MSDPFEESATQVLRDYILHQARLGIYDPLQPRRPRVEVVSFEVDLLEFDEENSIAHAAGPVVLRAANGDVEQYLRVSVPMNREGRIPDGAEFRAAYIVETNHASGACKETAAFAND